MSSFTRWRRLGLASLACAVVARWTAATPVVASWLKGRLESEFLPVEVEKLPASDVVILLGGAGLDLYNPTTRIRHALQIYRAGKAPLIVDSGGNADPLLELGVPRAALILDTESRNTRENAVNTAAIFRAHGWRSGILVTFHALLPLSKGWGLAWCRRRQVSNLDRHTSTATSSFRWMK